jgi:hypothetical protein
MDRATAAAEVERLRREHPDRATHDFIAQPLGDPAGEWRIVKIALPDGMVRPTGAHVEAAERPPMPDDPRPASSRNLGGNWVGF